MMARNSKRGSVAISRHEFLSFPFIPPLETKIQSEGECGELEWEWREWYCLRIEDWGRRRRFVVSGGGWTQCNASQTWKWRKWRGEEGREGSKDVYFLFLHLNSAPYSNFRIIFHRDRRDEVIAMASRKNCTLLSRIFLAKWKRGDSLETCCFNSFSRFSYLRSFGIKVNNYRNRVRVSIQEST